MTLYVLNYKRISKFRADVLYELNSKPPLFENIHLKGGPH